MHKMCSPCGSVFHKQMQTDGCAKKIVSRAKFLSNKYIKVKMANIRTSTKKVAHAYDLKGNMIVLVLLTED